MKSREISEFLQTRIDAREFPSAVYLVAKKGEIIFRDALGLAVVEPEKIEAKIDTIFDLASLTKPLVTGLLCAKLIDKGEINLSDKVAKFMVEFDTNEKREITVENLLTHTSGFEAWKPLYLIWENFGENSIEELAQKIASENLVNLPNEKVVYSDLNFILLGYLLEKIYERIPNALARKEIIDVLKLERTYYNPPGSLQGEIAASEKGNEYEKQICEDLGYETTLEFYPWTHFRDYQIWGEVHDANCSFMNGVSGHAGLFSTAEETFKIAQQFLPKTTKLLKPETCELFRTNYTKGFNEARSIAFQLAQTKDSTASEALAKDSFGHLGFTGTSLWIEPETERIYILLTNRTHARELPFANINQTRRQFHALAAEVLNEK